MKERNLRILLSFVYWVLKADGGESVRKEPLKPTKLISYIKHPAVGTQYDRQPARIASFQQAVRQNFVIFSTQFSVHYIEMFVGDVIG